MLQTPLHEYIGMNGCQFYNAVVLAHGHWLLIGGFEMALFRLLCLIGKSTKYLYHLGILLEVGQVTLALIATSNRGWKTSRYAINMINLKGQMIVFLSKIAITIFIYIASGTFSEPSFTSPILIFIPPTIISLSQLYTSHDIKLYLRMKLQN